MRKAANAAFSSIGLWPFIITAQFQIPEIQGVQWKTQIGMFAPNEVAITQPKFLEFRNSLILIVLRM